MVHYNIVTTRLLHFQKMSSILLPLFRFVAFDGLRGKQIYTIRECPVEYEKDGKKKTTTEEIHMWSVFSD